MAQNAVFAAETDPIAELTVSTDSDAYYLYQTRMSVVWPVDANEGKLVGEETYTGTDGFAGIAERKIGPEDIAPLSI